MFSENLDHHALGVIKGQLSAGERLLWSGQPKQGVFLRGSDTFLIPFSLMWGGFAFYWEFSVIKSNAPLFFMLWGIPFVLAGLYLIAGRFFFEAKQRSRTFYAVTNERILIVSGIFNQTTKSLGLRTLSDISIVEGKNADGTISFGGSSPFSSLLSGFSGWPGMGQHIGPSFEMIGSARAVYETIRTAQKDAT
jgi:hypothetical protein